MLNIAFFLAATALLLQGTFLPRLAILPFAPLIALFALRLPLTRALWLSALAGMFTDLFSNDPIGLHALNYTVVTALLFPLRNHFLSERPLHLSLFTTLVSITSTVLQFILLFLFDRRVPFGGQWAFTDFVGMPMIDALYAFVWFSAPLSLWDKLRRMWMLFWLKRKNLSPTSH